MSTIPSVSVSVTIANAVKAQVRTYGQTTAMIKAAYTAEGMGVGPTLSQVVAILLDPAKTKGGESDRVTLYETFRKTTQRAIGDDCLIPPVFLLDKAANNACRVILMAKDITVEAVKAFGMPTREENKALMAIMVRDKVTAKPAPAPETDTGNEPESKAPTEAPAPAPAATEFDQLVNMLASMDADGIRQLVSAIGSVNPAQLVTIGDCVNSALKASAKQAQESALLGSYKSAGTAPSTMALVPAPGAVSVVPNADVTKALSHGNKPSRKGNKRAAHRAA